MKIHRFAYASFYLFIPLILGAQTGSIYEPDGYIGGVTIDPRVHDGALPCAVGVESRQTVRVNCTHPDWL